MAFGRHPDVPWRLPLEMPSRADTAAGIAILEGALRPVDRQFAATCLQKLAVGFNMAQTAGEAKLRLEVWLEANGDLPGDLWESATRGLLQTYKFGMPKPSNLREEVDERFRGRKQDLARAREMIDQAPAARQQREPHEVRVRAMRDSFRNIDNIFKAARYERELAEIEGREVEGWALEPPPEAAPQHAPQPELPKVGPETEARTLLSIAKVHRAQGRKGYAATLEQQAKALAPDVYAALRPEGDAA